MEAKASLQKSFPPTLSSLAPGCTLITCCREANNTGMDKDWQKGRRAEGAKNPVQREYKQAYVL